MVARNECIEDLRKSAKEKLIKEFRGSPAYKQTLKQLIVQVSLDYNVISLGHD
jgi:hypothetical protein